MHRLQRLSATTQTIRAQLYDQEDIVQERDDVGVYDGKEKTIAHDNGRIYLTTHRIIYIDAEDSYRNSRYLDLKLVKQTEYWARFLKSSPKITLLLADDDRSPTNGQPGSAQSVLTADGSSTTSGETWACHVCGYRNLHTSGNKCTLCGVTRLAIASSAAPSLNASTMRSASTFNLRTSTTIDAVEAGNRISCPSCTYLNHPSMVRCELCDSSLGTVSFNPPSPLAVASAPTSRPSTPGLANVSDNAFVRLSFRKGGDKVFYSALKHALQSKQWDTDYKAAKRKSAPAGAAFGSPANHRQLTVGLDGILKTIDLDARDQEDDMQEALSDLEALMTRAKDMVNLAQSLNAKLAEESAANVSDSNADALVRKSLVSLGLSAPAVTAEMAADEAEYRLQLAKELGTVLLGTGRGRSAVPVMQDGPHKTGMLSLDEVWCIWNRARGVALLSPQDLADVTASLPTVTRPQIRYRRFPSGLTVLYTPHYSETAFAARLSAAIAAAGDDIALGALSNVEIAKSEGITIALAQQMMELLEQNDGSIFVRDDGDTRQGTRWQLNVFQQLEREWCDVNFAP